MRFGLLELDLELVCVVEVEAGLVNVVEVFDWTE